MSREAVAEVLERALRDRAFAQLLRSNPAEALAGYDLDAAERAAIEASAGPAPGTAPLEERPRNAARLV